MNSVKSQDSDEKFVLLVVGEMNKRQSFIIDMLRDKYGDRLEVINQCEFEEIQGKGIDFMIIDEMVDGTLVDGQMRIKTRVEKSFKLRGREYWQKGRWG